MQTSSLVACIVAALAIAEGAAAQEQQDKNQPDKGSILTVTVSAISGRSLEGVMVRLPDQERRARTDWIGEARFFQLKPGIHKVQVRHIGYAPATVDVMVQGDSTEAVFMLEQVADTLAPINVTASWLTPHQRDFETRRKKGIGRFVTDTTLEKWGFRQLALVLPTVFPGIRAASAQDMTGRYVLQSLRTGSGCGGVDLYLDGFPIEREMVALYPADLYGAELYSRESAPPQYRRQGCHVLLMWSKW